MNAEEFDACKVINFDGSDPGIEFKHYRFTDCHDAGFIHYDETIDDILWGEMDYSSNSPDFPSAGRFKLCEYEQGTVPNTEISYNYIRRNITAHVYYWPKIGRYISGGFGGVGTSPELEYCSEKLDAIETIEEGNNIDEIRDDDWLCCTDDDGVTHKVRGARFKELFEEPGPPWENHDGGIWHVKDTDGTVYLREGPYVAYDVTIGDTGAVSWSEKERLNRLKKAKRLCS